MRNLFRFLQLLRDCIARCAGRGGVGACSSLSRQRQRGGGRLVLRTPSCSRPAIRFCTDASFHWEATQGERPASRQGMWNQPLDCTPMALMSLRADVSKRRHLEAGIKVAADATATYSACTGAPLQLIELAATAPRQHTARASATGGRLECIRPSRGGVLCGAHQEVCNFALTVRTLFPAG